MNNTKCCDAGCHGDTCPVHGIQKSLSTISEIVKDICFGDVAQNRLTPSDRQAFAVILRTELAAQITTLIEKGEEMKDGRKDDCPDTNCSCYELAQAKNAAITAYQTILKSMI